MYWLEVMELVSSPLKTLMERGRDSWNKFFELANKNNMIGVSLAKNETCLSK